MHFFFRTSVIAAVGVSGFWAGRYFEHAPKTFNSDSFPSSTEAFLGTDTVFARSINNADHDTMLPIPKYEQSLQSTGSKSSRIGQMMKYGFPSLDNVRSFDDFVLSYDKRNRVPNWVIEHLTPESVKFNDKVDRSKCDFHEDTSVHHFFRSQNTDYLKSGFDRGHLAAAGNHRQHQEWCQQTFILSNMAPQVGRGFNRDSWNRLEKYTRKLTKKYANVYVCTGPLYLPRVEDDGFTYVKYRVLGNNHVAVPTHFYKVILMEAADGTHEMEAFVMPNQAIPDETPLTTFRVPPESIERASGLLFYERLQRNDIKLINGKRPS